jgi:hypothetical protein
MYAFLNKYGQAAAFGLGVLITLIFFIQITSGIDAFEGMSKESQLESGIFSTGLYAAIALTILSFVAIVLFGVFYVASNPKSSIKGLLPFLAIVLVFIISYAMAKPAEAGAVARTVEQFGLSEGQEKFVAAGLTTTGILFFGAALAFAVSEVRNFFK